MRQNGNLIKQACAAALLLALLSLIPGVSSLAGEKERSQIPAKYKWDLTSMYASEADWQRARDDLTNRLPALESHKGRLGVSADELYHALQDRFDFQRDVERLYAYAFHLSDEDSRIAHHREMRDSAAEMNVRFGTAVSWMSPELLAIGSERLHAFIAQDDRLKPYLNFVEDTLRYAPHTLDPAGEKLLAQTESLKNTGTDVRYVLNNAELPWPTVTLNGQKVRLDDAAFTRYRSSGSRPIRDLVFREFFRAHEQFQGTYGSALNGRLKAYAFDKNVRNYNSSLEAVLFTDNIPANVYTQLIRDAHANLPTLHRYLKLRQRMLGLKQLRYEDLYAPLVASADRPYTPEETQELVLEAVQPLGEEYVNELHRGLESGWVDWYPSTGKQSGAYSGGSYRTSPYLLMNFGGTYDDVDTLAHESGHSMQTLLSDQHQPFVTHNYAIFVAEVASTLNENLLLHSMLARTQDRATRLFLLGSYLENIRVTLFRQSAFAEFELALHERTDKGESLSGEEISRMYLDIVRRYYGHDLGICRIDALYGSEWTYDSQFFGAFYIYQNATSMIASMSLARGIRSERPSTAHRDAYMRLLESGSSKYPVELLQDAGVNMLTSEPFDAAMQEMNSVMDEMEQLLKKKL
jgi:oligoendopeptidase F